jgi:hypothetical protein
MESFTSMYNSRVASLVGEYLVLERYQSVNILLLPLELKEMLEPSTFTYASSYIAKVAQICHEMIKILSLEGKGFSV